MSQGCGNRVLGRVLLAYIAGFKDLESIEGSSGDNDRMPLTCFSQNALQGVKYLLSALRNRFGIPRNQHRAEFQDVRNDGIVSGASWSTLSVRQSRDILLLDAYNRDLIIFRQVTQEAFHDDCDGGGGKLTSLLANTLAVQFVRSKHTQCYQKLSQSCKS